ncbi:MAG: TonB-dependent receptor, partial [Bacteroidia bacterium]|nr:TonB-dependent receptor [Bacteroidia bacterium]
MFFKTTWIAIILALVVNWAMGQSNTSKIKGVVKDKDSGEPVIYSNVSLYLNGVFRGGTLTDDMGEFEFVQVEPGSYDIHVSYQGKKFVETGIKVTPNRTIPVTIAIGTTTTTDTIVVVEYSNPLFEVDQTVVSRTIEGKEIQKLGSRNINTIIATTGGIYQRDDQSGFNVRGQRAEGTQYFVDGVRITGSLGLPQKAISTMSVITGGTPAEFGDLTGGAIQITTGAPSYRHTGGAEFVTSEIFDSYGYNLGALNASGPIWSKKDTAGNVLETKLGYFAAIEGEFQKDPDPSNIGVYQVKPEVMKNLEENPLRPSEDGTFFLNNAFFLRNSDFEKVKAKQSNRLDIFRANGRLDYEVAENAYIKIGGSFQRNIANFWELRNILAPNSTETRKENTYRGYIRFQQSITGDSASILKNVNYSIQADYTLFTRTREQAPFGDDYFRYGHIGSFDLKKAPFYIPISPGEPGYNSAYSNVPYFQNVAFIDTTLTFDAGNSNNPILANYNSYIFDYIRRNPRLVFFNLFQRPYLSGNILSLDDLLRLGGLRNGDSPQGIYNLWDAQGSIFGAYVKQNNEMFRITGQGTAELGKNKDRLHNIKVGFEFEQRNDRFYSILTPSLWTLMRQLANKHIATLDLANPQPVYNSSGVFQDTVNYNRLYVEGLQSNFDRNLRAKLGLPVNGTDFIVTDKYDPSFYSLDMFSVNELLNGGSSLVTYYGYDFRGNRAKNAPAGAFFTDTLNRPQNAFGPTYISGYIQDRFELDKIFFQIGLRVDRFDANQYVLKDKYLLYPTYTAQEAASLLGIRLPDGISGDFVPYVNDLRDPNKTIIGYRDGEKWYDANGTPVSGTVLASQSQAGKVQPFVKQDTAITFDAFKDYEPQVNLMPR